MRNYQICGVFIICLLFIIGCKSQSEKKYYDPNEFIHIKGHPEINLGGLIEKYGEKEVVLTGAYKWSNDTVPGIIEIYGKEYQVDRIEENIGLPGSEKFTGTIVFPEGIKYIDGYFTYRKFREGKRYVKKLLLPNTLKLIGHESFSYSDIDSLDIPPSVENIDYRAFYFCQKLKNLELGKVKYIGADCFSIPNKIKWIKIPKETRLIGRQAFADSPLFFLQLTPTEINPVSNFERTFNNNYIPYIACASEFINPNIKAQYQSDMPKVFDRRAMIHLEESPIPLYFSFEETGDKEGLWETGIDLWAMTDSIATSESSILFPLQHFVNIRPDFSMLTEEQKENLQIFYNDREITDSLDGDRFTIDHGKIFHIEDLKSDKTPTYNRLRLILKE